MASTRTPCRLSVYLAADAPLAVVLRRGPSSWVRLSLWHTEDDTFEHGQWMKNRVYERRCDLSADGSLFVYFAFGASSHDPEPGKDSWVAVSRPPWFTALALWFSGTTYHTGGLFPDGRALWLGFDAGTPDRGTLPAMFAMTNTPPPFLDQTNNWTDRTVWLSRLWRAGWRPVEGAGRETWERPHPHGDRTLVMSWPVEWGRFEEPIGIEYALVSEPDGNLISLGRADWADWDQQGRLVLAKDGRIAEWRQPDVRREIADFNPQKPNPEPSPPLALIWPHDP